MLVSVVDLEVCLNERCLHFILALALFVHKVCLIPIL